MIDTAAVQTAVGKAADVGSIGLQTALIIACLEAIALIKKYGPVMLSVFRKDGAGGTNGGKKINGSRCCPEHGELMLTVRENTIAVKALTEKADQHHEQQSHDLEEVRQAVERDLRDLRQCAEEQGREIAEHGMAISFLRENSRKRNVA